MQFLRRRFGHVGESVGAHLHRRCRGLPFLRLLPGPNHLDGTDGLAGFLVQDHQVAVIGQDHRFALRPAGQGPEPVGGAQVHRFDRAGHGVDQADAGGPLLLGVGIRFVVGKHHG